MDGVARLPAMHRHDPLQTQRRAHTRLARDAPQTLVARSSARSESGLIANVLGSWDSRHMQRMFCAISFALSTATAMTVWAQEDVARVLKQQTQELFDAVTSGDARVWDRYLDANVIYLSEDGTRK